MTPAEWVAYVIIQLIAAVLSGLLVRAIGGHETAAPVASTGKMLVVEFIFAFALVYTVLNVATARGTEGNSFYGLAIGGLVVAGAFAVGGISGAAFDPAIALGASVTGLFKWAHYWIYVVADLAGAIVAGVAFLIVQPQEKATGDTLAAEPRG